MSTILGSEGIGINKDNAHNLATNVTTPTHKK